MKKGVSPVVATVLLIAIAVISAVAVWYWVSPLTSPAATPSTTQYGFVVTGTYKPAGSCTSIDIKNSGGTTIPINTAFEIFNINGTSAGKYVWVNYTSITSGSTVNFNITLSTNATTNIPVGSYLLRASKLWSGSNIGFTDVYFTC